MFANSWNEPRPILDKLVSLRLSAMFICLVRLLGWRPSSRQYGDPTRISSAFSRVPSRGSLPTKKVVPDWDVGLVGGMTFVAYHLVDECDSTAVGVDGSFESVVVGPSQPH